MANAIILYFNEITNICSKVKMAQVTYNNQLINIYEVNYLEEKRRNREEGAKQNVWINMQFTVGAYD